MKLKSRRELLKDAGLLGLLAGSLRESMALADTGTSGIRRLVLFYLPGGVHAPAWRPTVAVPTGVPIDMPKYGQMDKATNSWRHILDVFDLPKYAALKQDMMLIDGMDMRATTRPDVHVNGIWTALRGRPQTMDPAELGKFSKFSIDRLIGDGLERQNRADNLLVSQCTNVLVSELGNLGGVAACSEGYKSRVVKSSAEAWDIFLKDVVESKGGPVDNTTEVARLTSELDRWDLSTASTKKMAATLPRSEAAKLDQLAGTFRQKQDEIRRRVSQLSKAGAIPINMKAFPAPTAVDPDPSKFMQEKSDLLAKVMSMALALNRTQVVVWQTCDSNNAKGYWYNQGLNPDFHNDVGHHGGYQGTINRPTWDVYRIEMQMLGNLLLELKAIPEGNGTALDSTLVVTYSDMCNGKHEFGIPNFTLIAGGKNGRLDNKSLRLGKYIKLPEQRANNDLLLTIAHLMGVSTARDASGTIVPFDTFGSLKHSKGMISEIFS